MTNWECEEHEKTNGDFIKEILGENLFTDFRRTNVKLVGLLIEEEWFNAPCNTITTKDGRLYFSYEPM